MTYYHIIIIRLLPLSSLILQIHSFYIKNAAIVEQCLKEKHLYLNTFEPNKMHCFNNTWRQINVQIAYKCKSNQLTPTWTIKTSNKQYTTWPSDLHILIGNVSNFVCYYGKTMFKLTNSDRRNEFNKFLDNVIKQSSNSAHNNFQQNSNASAMASQKKTFWEKNKTIVLAGGGVCLLIVISIIIIIWRYQSSKETSERKMSVSSTID
ncbi:hypothetical protein I4U23_019250 [Adineta vaga]|nr:hypothetical protein I4U23_019250 [Adineta vaga]